MKTVFLSQKTATQIVYKFVCFIKFSSLLAFVDERRAGTILGYVNTFPFIRLFDRHMSTALPLLSKTLCLNQSLRTVKVEIIDFAVFAARHINLLRPNDIYICRTAALTSKRYILNIYSTNKHTEYFKHAA